MKATYIKPATDIVMLSVDKAYLQTTAETVMGNSPHGYYEDAAEGNVTTFDDEEDWGIPANSSLWDE